MTTSRLRIALAALLVATPLAAALAGPVEGAAAWEAGDYERAVAEWRPAAITGDAASQYGLGQAYLYGRGVPADLKQARVWFEKAAGQGYREAQDNLGLLLFQEGERTAALPYLQRSAARGEPRAQYVLGTAKFNGDLVDKDWVGAYALMTRASAAGLPQASRALAQMDQQIPLSQRQQGQVVARDMAVSAMAAPAVNATSAPAPQPAVAVASLPAAPSPTAPLLERPQSSRAPAERAVQPVAQSPVRAPVRAPAGARAPVAAARSGDWRIQLGAFRTDGSARSRWMDVKAAVPSLADLQPFYPEGSGITRTQAGPFASSAAAEAACKPVTASGRACFATRK